MRDKITQLPQWQVLEGALIEAFSDTGASLESLDLQAVNALENNGGGEFNETKGVDFVDVDIDIVALSFTVFGRPYYIALTQGYDELSESECLVRIIRKVEKFNEFCRLDVRGSSIMSIDNGDKSIWLKSLFYLHFYYKSNLSTFRFMNYAEDEPYFLVQEQLSRNRGCCDLTLGELTSMYVDEAALKKGRVPSMAFSCFDEGRTIFVFDKMDSAKSSIKILKEDYLAGRTMELRDTYRDSPNQGLFRYSFSADDSPYLELWAPNSLGQAECMYYFPPNRLLCSNRYARPMRVQRVDNHESLYIDPCTGVPLGRDGFVRLCLPRGSDRSNRMGVIVPLGISLDGPPSLVVGCQQNKVLKWSFMDDASKAFFFVRLFSHRWFGSNFNALSADKWLISFPVLMGLAKRWYRLALKIPRVIEATPSGDGLSIFVDPRQGERLMSSTEEEKTDARDFPQLVDSTLSDRTLSRSLSTTSMRMSESPTYPL